MSPYPVNDFLKKINKNNRFGDFLTAFAFIWRLTRAVPLFFSARMRKSRALITATGLLRL